ncbi:MAG TPA: hypothetical protein PLQ97_03430 [Myxococcota bacterium]|nr:hypothetical protein [Myxococcota bacterium]HQK50093.1 hypothetical protein [Myxococcota bacterium]
MRRSWRVLVAGWLVGGCGGGQGGTDLGPGPDGAGEDPGPAAEVVVAETAGEDPAVLDDWPVEDRTSETATDEAPADPGSPPAVTTECAAIEAGRMNSLTVDGTRRWFYFSAPEDAVRGPRGRWPLVFLWHGFSGAAMDGDTAAISFQSLLSAYVGNDGFPFLLVTPLADGIALLDWNILDIASGDDSPDVRLFDEVLACLDARFGVDPDHVHSAGFSAGAIMTDLLGVTRGDRLASLISWSGAYLSNEANDTGAFDVFWPDVGPSRGYAQLVTRGGPNDVWRASMMFTADFDQWTRNDIPWLNARGHEVLECVHDRGHIPIFTDDFLYAVRFFQDHPRGVTDSPYADGIPASFPPDCLLHRKAVP